MAENLEALNDKWYHILEERQSNLLDTEHENQDDENHSSLYLGYYQEIMDEISDGKFFDSNDTGMTDQAVDRKIKQKLDELMASGKLSPNEEIQIIANVEIPKIDYSHSITI